MGPNQKEEEILPEKMITTCVDCKTTKTPLWRSGPAGPKSLCNACGIRYRKKRAATPPAAATDDLNKEEEKISKEITGKKKRKANIRSGKYGKLSVEWRQRLMALREELVLFQRQRSPLKKRQRFHRKLGEVEQAAVLLMALSCDSVFA